MMILLGFGRQSEQEMEGGNASLRGLVSELATFSDSELADLAPAATEAIRSYLDVPYLVLNASGLVSLQAALFAAGAGAGTNVICDALFPFGIMAAQNVGAEPVVVDVDPERLTLNPEAVAASITKRTRAVIATATFGVPAPTTALREVTDEWPDVVLIEDHAQAFGVRIGGEFAARRPDMACFSFHTDKPLSAGFGGGVVCKRRHEYERSRRYLELGWYPRQDPSGGVDWEGSWRGRAAGCQSARLPPIAAGLLLSRLERFDHKARQHRTAVEQVVATVNEHLPRATLQKSPEGFDGQRWRVALLLPTRTESERLTAALREGGSWAYRYEHPPASRWPNLEQPSFRPLPVSTDVLERLLVLPVMGPEDAAREIAAVKSIL